ncbi:hypothetical protein CJU89_3956 [Yarrowia sp. B02]|nr:hypothetical protein CJU89_3956 [Yarrowia sp. B02]
MSKISIKNSNGNGVTLSAVINKPGLRRVQETAGTYAKDLAKQGFVTIAYDASFQGESTGEPRGLEDPYVRTGDISVVVDYFETLPLVDAEKIGAMGICAGGGYTANAAINDPRIKAIGTVSAVNVGQMFRNGWDGSVKDADAAAYIKAGTDARTLQAKTGEIPIIPLAPAKKEDAPSKEMEGAWEYYHTPERSTPPPSPKWMSEDLIKRAASKDKDLQNIKGADHMDLYDKVTDEVWPKLAGQPPQPQPENPETPSEPSQPSEEPKPQPETPETPNSPSEPSQPENPQSPQPETPQSPPSTESVPIQTNAGVKVELTGLLALAPLLALFV